MLPKNFLLLACLILIHFLQTSSYAKQLKHQNPSCNYSTCGNIHNISYPFRLKVDPQHCGDPFYEISCENNIPSIYFYPHRFHVQAISYHNYTIRIADPDVKNNDSCSFPTYCLNYDNFSYPGSYPYSILQPRDLNYSIFYEITRPITFFSCPFPLNDSVFTEAEGCVNGNRHTYMKAGYIKISDVRDMCRLDMVVLTSFQFKDKNNISPIEIHESLLYGFELSWLQAFCGSNCSFCQFDGKKAFCYDDIYPPSIMGFKQFLSDLVDSALEGNWLYGMRQIFKDPSGFKQLLTDFIDSFYWIPKIFKSPTGDSGLKYHYYLYYAEKIFESFLLASDLYFIIRFLLGMAFLLGLIIYKLRRRHLSVFDSIESFLQNHNNLMPIRYSYSHIKKMTAGFREKLGQGGYGSVYKGKLRSGSIVAVKVLNKRNGNGQDFINEVATIGRIHHVNVVRLVGYCAERSKCALVYDFMPNGSLDKYVCSRQETSGNLLSWGRKYDIAVGVARGIEYLHRGCDIQILHFDIKPHNILLDENFIPKISDFGLAKSYSTEKNTVTLTAVRGTIGYVAPELMNRSIGSVSYKADVYSFGMLLIEIVGLKKDMAENDCTSSSGKYFPDWIYDHFNKHKDIEIGNMNDDYSRKLTRKMTIVALWCIQMNPSDRPPMSKVLEMLESETELLQIPIQHFQSPNVAENYVQDQTWETDSTDP